MADRYQTAAEFAQAIAEWMQAAQVAPLPSRKGSMSFSGSTPSHPTSGASPALTPTATAALTMSAATHGLALEKTATSGSVLTPNPVPRRRSGVVAALAIVMTLGAAGAGIGFVRWRAAKVPPTTAAAAQIAAEPEPPATHSADSAALAPPPDTVAAEAPAPSPTDSKALADANAHAAPPVNHAPAAPAHHAAATAPAAPPPPAPAPQAASSANENSTTIKGRTIRTEL